MRHWVVLSRRFSTNGHICANCIGDIAGGAHAHRLLGMVVSFFTDEKSISECIAYKWPSNDMYVHHCSHASNVSSACGDNGKRRAVDNSAAIAEARVQYTRTTTCAMYKVT